MIRRPPRSTPLYSSAASDVYKRQGLDVAGDLADWSLGRIDCDGRNEFGQPTGVDPYLPLVNRLERPVGEPDRWGGFHQAVVGLAQGHRVAQVGRPTELPGRGVV